MKNTLLTVDHLNAWYNSKKTVLADLSLQLAVGEVAGLIGLNGAGKTTFFNVLSGLHPTFRCDGLLFDGRSFHPRERDFKLGRYTVFAEDNSFPYFTFLGVCETPEPA